jgi:hypothetical protein
MKHHKGRAYAKEKDMRLQTSNIRSICRAGALELVSRELMKYNLDLVEVLEVRLDKSGTNLPNII